MGWSFGDLMDLPADLYPELVAWLNDEARESTHDYR